MHHSFSKDVERSEQIDDIIEKMPRKFGFVVTSIVIVLVLMLFIFGYIISYPDVVAGKITITAPTSPIKIVANSSGKIHLLGFRAKDNIEANSYIAVVQNPAKVEDVLRLKKLLRTFNINDKNCIKEYLSFPQSLSLGDINEKYYNFINAFQKIYNYQIGNSYRKQLEGFKDQATQLNKILTTDRQLKSTKKNNMLLYKKLLDRDSSLFAKKAAIEDEVDKSRIAYLESKQGYQNLENDINDTEQKLEDIRNKIQLLSIQKDDDLGSLRVQLISAFDDLRDNITLWEQRFVLKAPITGKIEYLKFWNDGDFIQNGEEAFTIIPNGNKAIGQMQLPSHGAGKVKVGQEVIIKLDDYPYEEYGSVKGKVSSISYTSKVLKVNDQNNVDAYLLDITLPDGLKTNYGAVLAFKYEAKGSAEIISNDRKLIERFFDNLKYSVKNH